MQRRSSLTPVTPVNNSVQSAHGLEKERAYGLHSVRRKSISGLQKVARQIRDCEYPEQ